MDLRTEATKIIARSTAEQGLPEHCESQAALELIVNMLIDAGQTCGKSSPRVAARHVVHALDRQGGRVDAVLDLGGQPLEVLGVDLASSAIAGSLQRAGGEGHAT